MVRFSFLGSGCAVALVLAGASSANAVQTLVQENFSSDPIAGGRAVVSGEAGGDASRFTYNAGSQSLTVAYDSAEPSTKLLWGLGRTLTQNDSFAFSVDFTLDSVATLPYGAQIAFGFVNSVTTGNDRAGGEGASAGYPVSGSDANDAHDTVSVDYFPYQDSFYPTLTYSPTVISSWSGDGTTSFYNQFTFPDHQETLIEDAGEPGALATGVAFTSEFTYDAASRTITLRLRDGSGYLPINTVGYGMADGGFDGDITTIQSQLDQGTIFSVDSFGLLLWEDTYGAGTSTVLSNVTVTGFAVTIPEPTSLALLVGTVGLLLVRRRRP